MSLTLHASSKIGIAKCRKAFVDIELVSYGLPKTRSVEKTVTLVDDDVVDLLILKLQLFIGLYGIEDGKGTIMFAG